MIEKQTMKFLKSWNKSLKWVAITSICSILVLAIATHHGIKDLPKNLEALVLESSRPIVLDRNGIRLTTTYQSHWNVHDELPLHEIPAFLRAAFITAEDKRFFAHQGVDWLARLRALFQNTSSLTKVSGASTISEQVVRMIHPRKRNLWSRWLEGWESVYLEQQVGKEAVLEFYLNQVPFAANRRGVAQAAKYYFDRSLDSLNRKEQLALAVMVRAPSRFNLFKDPNRINGRIEDLADRMIGVGWDIEKEQLQAEFNLSKAKIAVDARHFAKTIALTVPFNELSRRQIITTLSAEYQQIANNILTQRLVDLRAYDVNNAAMVVVDLETNEIIVWSVANSETSTAYDYDAVSVKRQPGSTLKPFIYAATLERGWTAASLIVDAPFAEAVNHGVHQYRNYSGRFYGPISLRRALANSLNIPAVKAAELVGTADLAVLLDKLGLHAASAEADRFGIGIALGTAPVSLLELVQAYSVLANRGLYSTLRWHRDSQAQIQKGAISLPSTRKVFSAEQSSLIADILSDDDARKLEFGGSVLNFPSQTAIKTGTSNDYRDAWTVAFNNRYLVGVWMGNLDNTSMRKVTGSIGPAVAVKSMFQQLNKNIDNKALFLSQKLESRNVCLNATPLDNAQCEERVEYFLSDQINANEFALAFASNYVDTNKSHDDWMITSPLDGSKLAMDPRVPSTLQVIKFSLNHYLGASKVEWSLNGQLLPSVSVDDLNWKLRRGKHVLEVQIYDAHGSQIASDKSTFSVL